ncbi:MAG TPA: hypothetical protein VEH31_29380, partial [Streptosporangiaceae bacterium]|nr:hypothetical protein [Streptosporangiaceae bacterium]
PGEPSTLESGAGPPSQQPCAALGRQHRGPAARFRSKTAVPVTSLPSQAIEEIIKSAGSAGCRAAASSKPECSWHDA